MAGSLNILEEKGKGRSFLVLYEEQRYEKFAKSLAEALAHKSRVLLIQLNVDDWKNWERVSDELESILEQYQIRQASFVSFGAACIPVQHLSLVKPKMVRAVISVDASTRSHPNALSKFFDRIERSLPLGLPFRLRSTEFDSKPFLQRLRSPNLVVSSSHADSYQRAEAKLLQAGLPTAWGITLDADREVEELCEKALLFQDIPAKCPQKRKG